jgi:GNAT superfamily N-acetyltransferase
MPSHGRRGVGTRILRRLERLAREVGAAELHLDASVNAERFYRAHGYAAEGRDEHELWTGRRMACVRMRKHLTAERDPDHAASPEPRAPR